MSRTSNTNVVLDDNQFATEFDPKLLVVSQPQSEGLSAEQSAIVASSATKSEKIRRLIASGMKRGDVAKALGIRYQFVRNVELTPLKRK